MLRFRLVTIVPVAGGYVFHTVASRRVTSLQTKSSNDIAHGTRTRYAVGKNQHLTFIGLSDISRIKASSYACTNKRNDYHSKRN